MNIIRYYNQNRKRIWGIVIIIIFAIVFLKLLNVTYLKQTKNKIENNNFDVSKTNTVTQEENSNTKYSSDKSSIKGSSVSKSNLENAQNVFDNFFNACNNQKYEEAYNLLTDKCKELVYPSLKSFKLNYYDNVFKGEKKAYSFENWFGNTYYVKLTSDALSTGKVTSEKDAKYDYITIEDNKLNISTYIGSKEINKTKESKNIIVRVDSKDTFMDYEIYNITIKNNNDSAICLTDTKSTNDIYIKDANDVKYGVYNHELLKNKMTIEPGYTTKLSFKFYSSYISNKEIKSLTFKNIDMNNAEAVEEYTIDW